MSGLSRPAKEFPQTSQRFCAGNCPGFRRASVARCGLTPGFVLNTLRFPMKQLINEAYDVARYRGGSGHWSYLLHRVTGVGVLLFLAIHIVDTALNPGGGRIFLIG